MKAPLFDLWFFVTASDAVGAVLAIVTLYRVRTRFSLFLAIVFGAIAFESFVAAGSLLIFWPNEVEVAPAFALWRSGGRFVKAVGVWALVLFLMNFCSSGIHKTITGDRDKPGV